MRKSLEETTARTERHRHPKQLMYSQTVLAVEEYRQRLKDRESRVAHYEKLHIRLGNIRLALALATAGMAWESIWRHAFPYWWLAVPAVVFASLAVYHSRVLRA